MQITKFVLQVHAECVLIFWVKIKIIIFELVVLVKRMSKYYYMWRLNLSLANLYTFIESVQVRKFNSQVNSKLINLSFIRWICKPIDVALTDHNRTSRRSSVATRL